MDKFYVLVGLGLPSAMAGAIAGALSWLTATLLRMAFAVDVDPPWWPTIGVAAAVAMVVGLAAAVVHMRSADSLPRVFATAGLLGGVATFHFTGAGAVAALVGGFIAHRAGRVFGQALLDFGTGQR